MIIRIDDISPNTDLDHLRLIINEIKSVSKDIEVMICVNILSKQNETGSVYPDPPFKHQPLGFFLQVDQSLNMNTLHSFTDVIMASHGLIHSDHSSMAYQSQELSIVTSCSLLGTNVFVPPFNKYNPDTLTICESNAIQLIKPEYGWASLDYHALVLGKLDPNHNRWYMHPWRWSIESFKEKFTSKIGRLIQADS